MPAEPAPGTHRSPAATPSRFLRWHSRRVMVFDESMLPTLRPGDRLLVDTHAYRFRRPVIGDIVVLIDPAEPKRWLVKRVGAIGPATLWRTHRGMVPFDRTPGEAEAIRPPDAIEKVDVPHATLFVTGDAEENARDSRRFGPVPIASLIGRVYRCYDPPSRRRDL